MLKHVFIVYGKPMTGKSILTSLMTSAFSLRFKVHTAEDGFKSFEEISSELDYKAEMSKNIKFIGRVEYDDYFVIMTNLKERAMEMAKYFKDKYLKEFKKKYGKKSNFLISICGMEAVL